MLKVLRQAGSVLLKLGLSAVAIGAFVYISARAPFLRDNAPLPTVAPPRAVDAGAALPRDVPAQLAFADRDARFNGSFFAQGQDAGFQLSEVDLDGPCAGAGERHLRQSCPDCLVTPVPTEPGEPPTLFWSRTDSGEGNMGTAFRDCLRELPSGQVRVALLSFSEDRLSLADVAEAAEGVAVPRLAGTERTSHMTLGNWAVTVDTLGAAGTALDDMGRLLADAGWAEVRQGPEGAEEEQRVFERPGAQLCVVTLSETEDGFQLVTMMTI